MNNGVSKPKRLEADSEHMNYNWSETELSVQNAVIVVLLTSIAGYTFGFLITVHLVSSLAEAVWVTTVLFTLIGLNLWGARRS